MSKEAWLNFIFSIFFGLLFFCHLGVGLNIKEISLHNVSTTPISRLKILAEIFNEFEEFTLICRNFHDGTGKKDADFWTNFCKEYFGYFYTKHILNAQMFFNFEKSKQKIACLPVSIDRESGRLVVKSIDGRCHFINESSELSIESNGVVIA